MTANLIYGDSHMDAEGFVTSAPSKAMCALIPAALGLSFTNVAFKGHCAADQADAVYAHPLAAGGIGIGATGTNDNRACGESPPRQQAVLDCKMAMAVSLATNRKPCNDPSLTYTGSWGDSFHGVADKVSSVAGSTVTIPFNGGVLYLGMLRLGTASYSPASFRVKPVGGTTWTTYSLSQSQDTFFKSGTGDLAPKLIRLAGFGAGAHSVILEVLTGSVFFSWFSTPDTHARVYLLNTPHAVDYSGGGSQLAVDQNNAAEAAYIATLQADGVQVYGIDMCGALLPSDMRNTQDSTDKLHMNDAGHEKVKNLVVTATGLTAPPPPPTYSAPVTLRVRLNDSRLMVDDGTTVRETDTTVQP